MSLDHSYEALYKKAHELQFKVHDAIDDHHHPTAQTLKHELEHLEHDIEQSKSPRDIENRVKSIQHAMLEARSQQRGFMSIDDADHFHRTYEDMRRTVRDHPRYS